MALMEDERRIIRWLTQYGPMTKGMIGKLLYFKSSETVSRILAGLRRGNYITQTPDGQYYTTDKYCPVDHRMHEALWVLFHFLEQVRSNAHHAGEDPVQIVFLKDGFGYEIVVLHDQEEHLVQLLQPQETTKYIFVVPNLEFADRLELPDVPCLFATIESSDREIPEVTFYSD